MNGSRRIAPRWRHRLVEVLRGPSWRRVVLARRLVAALFAVSALVLALAPSEGEVEVVVVAREVAAGATLAAGDLAVRQWPRAQVPDGALRDPAAAQGRVLVGAARAGEAVTDVRLVGPELARREGSPDAAAVPVRLADADVAALLVAGSRVDVVTVGPSADEPVVLARDAIVLAVLPPGDTPGARGRLALVGLPRALATRVAAASLAEQVAVTLR